MGVDISAIKLGTFNPDPRISEVDDLVHITESDDFPGRLGGVSEGYYSEIECKHFYRSGYGSYNRWRNLLAQMAGYPILKSGDRTGADVGAWNADGGPFWELINFSDCEGFIGGAVAAKIAEDFKEHSAKASEFECLDPSSRLNFTDSYQKIKAAFDFAALRNGVVKFS